MLKVFLIALYIYTTIIDRFPKQLYRMPQYNLICNSRNASGGGAWLIGVVYKPPSGNFPLFVEKLTHLIG